VASSAEIGDPARKELLEHLSVVSGEAAKPSADRKAGPLRMSFEAVKQRLVSRLSYRLFGKALEHALKTAGILSAQE